MVLHNYKLNIKTNQIFSKSLIFNPQLVDIETIFFRDFIQPFES